MAVQILNPKIEEDLLGCDGKNLGYLLNKNGLVDLGIKDYPWKYREDHHDYPVTSYSRNESQPYKQVKKLTPLQESIAAIVDETLSGSWYFRQMRVRAENGRYPVRSEITRGESRLSLVLLYQRKETPPPFKELETGSELTGLAGLCAGAGDRINEAVKTRYFLSAVNVSYDHHSEFGRSGAGGGDARILVVSLYFMDRKVLLYATNKEIRSLKLQLSEKLQAKIRLEGLLHPQK